MVPTPFVLASRACHTASIATVAAALVLSEGCARHTPSTSAVADASGLVEVSVRVPAALSVARAMDTLSVAIDPASLGSMEVTAHAGMVLGVEADVFVFPQGMSRSVLERHVVVPGVDFDAGASTWGTSRDGVPAPETRYVVEVRLVLFETDVPAATTWDPHAGNFSALWTRTLRQAEE